MGCSRGSRQASALGEGAAGLMQCIGVMMAGSHQRKPVGNVRVKRQELRDFKFAASCRDRPEGAADFTPGIRLHVKEVKVAWSAVIVDEDDRAS